MNWRSIGILTDPLGVLFSLLPATLRPDGTAPVTAQSQEVEVACRLNKGDLPTLLELHRRHPDISGPMVTLCEVLEEQRQWPELLACAQDLRRRFPFEMEGYRKASVALRLLKRADEADRVIRAATRRFPRSLGATVESALCADAQDNPRKSLRRWRTVRRQHAWYFAAWSRSVNALEQLGRRAAADTLLRDIHEHFPNNAQAWTLSAEIAEKRGDIPGALRNWSKARTLFPSNPAIYVNQSRLLRQCGEIPAAAACMVDASFLFSENKDVLAERETLISLGADPGPLSPPRPPPGEPPRHPA